MRQTWKQRGFQYVFVGFWLEICSEYFAVCRTQIRDVSQYIFWASVVVVIGVTSLWLAIITYNWMEKRMGSLCVANVILESTTNIQLLTADSQVLMKFRGQLPFLHFLISFHPNEWWIHYEAKSLRMNINWAEFLRAESIVQFVHCLTEKSKASWLFAVKIILPNKYCFQSIKLSYKSKLNARFDPSKFSNK